jgi:Mn2+/Fe2+ NRAMP family transporter
LAIPICRFARKFRQVCLSEKCTSIGIDPVRALYWAAVVNGVLAAPLMAAMMLIVRNPRAMGRLTLSRGATLLGWCATLVMFAATGLFFVFAL